MAQAVIGNARIHACEALVNRAVASAVSHLRGRVLPNMGSAAGFHPGGAGTYMSPGLE